MNSNTNKRVLMSAYDGLANGDPRALVDLMADDFVWEIPGTCSWSGRWEGKNAVLEKLLMPLGAQFAGRYTGQARRFVAEADLVVVEFKGHVATRSGHRYDNGYCSICRFENGLLKELTEYMDTALVDRILDPPPERPLASTL